MCIYLDYAAASPMLSAIIDGHAELCRRFVANPHGGTRFSTDAKEAARLAEWGLLESLGVPDDQARVVWTSGGTEADNLITLGILRRGGRGPVVVDAGAHPALLEPCRRHAEQTGGSCLEIPLDHTGGLRLEGLDPATVRDAALVAVCGVNNETGAVLDLAGLRRWMRSHTPRALLAVDAVQAVGRIPIPWETAAIDAMAVSARKIGGPAGVGAAVLRRGTRLEPLLYGGGQQDGLRPGTLDVVGACEAVQAAREAAARRVEESARIAALNRCLRAELAGWADPQVRLLSPDSGVPHILALLLPGFDGAVVARLLAERGVLVSSGSACSAESAKTSHVARAMGVPAALARGMLRVSFGRDTCAADLEVFGRELRATLRDY